MLQKLAAALSEAGTAREIATAATSRGREMFGATATLLYLIDEPGDALQLIAHGGLSDARVAPYVRLPRGSDVAVARCVRDRSPVWLARRNEVIAYDPRLSSVELDGAPLQGVVALPLDDGRDAIGALAFSFYQPIALDAIQRDLFLTVASHCAIAIQRARAVEAERRASELLAQQRDRLALLAHASEVLSASLDSRRAMAQLAALVVPRIADWCAIDELDERGAIRRLTTVHVDPEKVALSERLFELYPPTLADAHGVGAVIRTGATEVVSEIPESILVASARSEEHLRIIQSLGLTSYAVVPLRARGRVLGALTLVAEHGRRMSSDEVDFALELARRAAGALENARLYESADAARRQLHDLFSNAPAAIAVARGREHRFELANEPYRALIGAGDVVGRTFREAVPELEGQGLFELVEAVFDEGAVQRRAELGARVRDPRGQVAQRFFDVVFQPIRDARGGVDGVATFAFDVTHQVDARRRVESLAHDVARSEARMRALVEATAAIVWNATPTGEVVEISPSWLAFTGQSEEEYRDGGFLDAIHPDDRARTMDVWLTAVGAGAPYAAEYRLRRRDGSYAHTLARGRPVRGSDGAVVEYVGCNVDVSELREAEAIARDHANTVTAINELGSVIAAELDGQRVVQAVTDAVTRLTGAQFGAFFYNVEDEHGGSYMLYTLSGVAREHFERFPMPRNTAVFAPTFAGQGIVRSDDITEDPRYGKNPPYRGMPEGHLPVRSYLAVPVTSRSGTVIGGLFLGHGERAVFGDREQTLATGLAAQAAVAMDNARLYGAAKRLIGALEAKNRELDQFAYVTSHDLRAPLRGIGSLAEWIEEDLGTGLDPEIRKKLELLRGRVHRMENLIQGILEYSRAARSEGRREAVDVAALLDEIVEMLAPPPGATVRAAGALPVVHTERVALSQVLMNLIANALRHSRRPDVTVTVDARDAGAAWEIRVADDGVGIDPAFHERVWGIFQTLSPRDEVESTGIGLAVVKKVVESRAGKAWIEATPGGGATFCVTWPKREQREER